MTNIYINFDYSNRNLPSYISFYLFSLLEQLCGYPYLYIIANLFDSVCLTKVMIVCAICIIKYGTHHDNLSHGVSNLWVGGPITA